MKTSRFLLLALGLVALAWLRPIGGGGQAQPASGKLPGARPTIEAINYPSLQAALDAVPEGGGVVRLPAGTFEVSEPLLVTRGDVLIQGAGTATHIKNVNAKREPAVRIQPANVKAQPKARLWRVKVADLRITGTPQSGHGIEAVNVDEIFIDGVSITENGGDGVHMDNCLEDARVCNSLFTYNKESGVYMIGCHDTVVSANQFEENKDALRFIDGYNLCMTGNCVDDHLRDGVVIENTYGSVVAGNMIEECAGTAIVLDRDCYGITLSANVIAHEEGGGVDLRDAHGCTVGGNTFTIVKKNALVIGPNSSRIVVTGNSFSDSSIGGGQFKRGTQDLAASGVTLNGTSDVVLSGNMFSGVKPSALAVEGDASRRVLFSNNVLTNASGQQSHLKDSQTGGNLEENAGASK